MGRLAVLPSDTKSLPELQQCFQTSLPARPAFLIPFNSQAGIPDVARELGSCLTELKNEFHGQRRVSIATEILLTRI